MDRSFEGLLISGIVHAFLVWLLFFAKIPGFQAPVHNATEVTLIETPPTQKKSKNFVTEPDLKTVSQNEDFKDSADFLSAFTKRVKKQIRASRTGPTVNAAPKASAPSNPALKVGGNVTPQRQQEPGIGEPAGGSQAMRTVAIGQSSIAEYIPGVQEGAFTSLNTDQFTYYTFFARMNEQVRNRWINMIRGYMSLLTNNDLQRLSTHERQTLIEIILTPEGQFRTALVHTSSGEKRLDTMPAEAFEMAAPFPNPPHGMVEADGLIHLKYAFVLQFRPPSFGSETN